MSPNTEKYSLHQDDEAFGSLYRDSYVKMVNHAYNKTNDAAAAEDIVQDVFLNLYLKRKTIENPKHYLLVALKNKIFDYWRKETLHDRHTSIIQKATATSSEQLWNDIIDKEMKIHLDKQVSSLPSKCRKVFVLRREEQLSNKEIAIRLGISVNTVEQHMRKALKILKSYYGYGTLIILLYLQVIMSSLASSKI